MNIETNVIIWQNSGPSGALSVHVLSSDGTNTFTYNATSSEIFVQIRQAGTYYLDNIRMYRTYEDTIFVSGHEVDRAYRYGFNSMERDNEIKGKGNSYDFGARMYDSRLGRWLTIDAKASKYPDLSPYNFVANSPLIFIDPDGKDIIIYGSGDNVNKYTAQLRTQTKLDIYVDIETNKLIVSGKPRNKSDRLLLQASQDEKVNVNIYTTTNSFFKSRSGINVPLLAGSFDGSEVTNGKVNTTKWVNPDHIELIGEIMKKNGVVAMHELLESYYGALNSPGYMPIPRRQQSEPNSNYLKAHYLANKLAYAHILANPIIGGKSSFVDQNKEHKETSQFELNSNVGSQSSVKQESLQTRRLARTALNAINGVSEKPVSIPKNNNVCNYRESE